MARRVLASGTTLQGLGAQVLTLAANPHDRSTPVLTNITAGFAFSPVQHYHYEVDVPEPTAAGSYYVLCSTTPPGPGIWPNGYSQVQAFTEDVTTSLQSLGTMKQSANQKTVYRANNLVVFIPDAAVAHLNCVDLPWTVDF